MDVRGGAELRAVREDGRRALRAVQERDESAAAPIPDASPCPRCGADLFVGAVRAHIYARADAIDTRTARSERHFTVAQGRSRSALTCVMAAVVDAGGSEIIASGKGTCRQPY